MYIGQAAKAAGTTVKAIRHYESLGLLGPVSRQGSYRVFSQRDVELLRLIKQAQALGFRLSELTEAMNSTDVVANWRTVRQLIDNKRTRLAREMAALETQMAHLDAYAERIDRCLEQDPDCVGPLI